MGPHEAGLKLEGKLMFSSRGVSPLRFVGLSIPAVLVAIAIAAPAGAAAGTCSFARDNDGGGYAGSISAGGPSFWDTQSNSTTDGDIEDGAILDPSTGLWRTDALDGYGNPTLTPGAAYDAGDSSTANCKRTNHGQGLVFPVAEIGGILVKPSLYFDPKKPFGRQLITLKNPTGSPLTFDLKLDGDLGSDSDTIIGTSSSGNKVVDSTDLWATSCDDYNADGCGVTTAEPYRDPELAHNWERQGKKPDSADEVVLADGDSNFDVFFNGVTINPGKTVSYMDFVTLALNIKTANKVAKSAAKDPEGYGAFKGIPKSQRGRIRNW
jgi:hypothetical protein